MSTYVIDTNLYVEAIRTDEGNAALAAFQRRAAPFLWQHSTVAQEILAGAHDEADYREYHTDWIAPFEALGRVVTPSHATWTRAALIIARLVERRQMTPGSLTRSFLNDCLIAASARERGFVLVTGNTADFALIGKIDPTFRHEPPWPDPAPPRRRAARPGAARRRPGPRR